MALDSALLVVVDHDVEGRLTAASAQLLTAARGISADVVALSIGVGDVDALGRFGASRVVNVELAPQLVRSSDALAYVVNDVMDKTQCGGVLVTSHYLGREIAARVAVKRNATPIVDVTALSEQGGVVHVSKPALAGGWEVDLHVEDAPLVVALRPGAVTEEEFSVTPAVETVDVSLPESVYRVHVVESVPQERTGRAPLAEARSVVVAGRGVEGDLTAVEELADILGASVGATRVVTDEGWAPRSLQVGQTGVNISPNLYVGVGVSGAIHHTVGMQSSRHIVAVVDDPDAPIVELADFVVIGDLFEVVPQAIEALKLAGYSA